ncbi:MAG: hypothetical protein ACRENP_07190 [Longimicrobiales bacterium]
MIGKLVRSLGVRCTLLVLLFLLPLLTTACDDEFTQEWVDLPDTVLLYSLSRPDLIGRPSAYDFVNGVPRTVETPGASGTWDVAVTEGTAGFSLVPAGAFTGLASRAAIATVTGTTLENLREAPADTARYSSAAVLVEQGKIYVVRSRRENCGFSSGSRFAKVEAVETNRTNGTLRFRAITNPYCNDRRLIPPN